MRQGDRRIRADCLRVRRRRAQSAKLEGGVEYTDPAAHRARQQRHLLAGAGRGVRGHGVRAAGAQRARRGAQPCSVDANGKVTLEDVSFTTCPANDVAWQMKAQAASSSTPARATARAAAPSVEFKGVPIFYAAVAHVSDRPAAQERLPVPEPRRARRATARRSRCLTTGTSGRTSTSRPQPVYYSKRGLDLAGELRLPDARGSAARSTSTICPATTSPAATARASQLDARRRAAGRMALPHRRHRRQRQRLLRGLRARARRAPACRSPSAWPRPPIATST